MSGDVRSGRAQLYVESDAHRAGDDPRNELLVEWARRDDRARRRDRRRARRAPSARRGDRGRDGRSGAGDEARRRLPCRGSPVRGRELRRRLAAQPRTISPRPGGPGRWRASRDRVLLVDTLNMGDDAEQAKPCGIRRTSGTTPRRNGGPSSSGAGLVLEQVSRRPTRWTSRPARAHRLRGRGGRCASSGRAAWRPAGSRSTRSR